MGIEIPLSLGRKQMEKNQQCKTKVNFIANRSAKLRHNLLLLVTFLFVMASLVLSTYVGVNVQRAEERRQIVIQEVWREQTRSVLADVRNQFQMGIADGEINYYDPASVFNWSVKRLSGVRIGGPTGDLFVVDLSNERAIWSATPDTYLANPIVEPIFLNDILGNFHDKTSGEKAFNEIRKHYTTNASSNITWNYDGAPALIEWIIVPTDNLGFNSTSYIIDGKVNPNYKAYLIGAGVQTDEIFKPMEELFLFDHMIGDILTVLNYLILLSAILFLFYTVYNHYLCHDGRQE